jgi:hypothetical protein
MNIQFKDEQIIDGIRFYIKDDDSLVIADQWDKMFKPEKLKPIFDRKYKGLNCNKKTELFNPNKHNAK